MKKLFYLAIVAMVITSCGNKQGNNQVEETENVKTEELKIQQITEKSTNENGDLKFYATVNFDFPTSGDAQLVKSIKEFIFEKLGTSFNEQTSGEDLAKQVAKQKVDYLTESLDADMEYEEKEFYNEINVNKQFENEYFVTYSSGNSLFDGGPHPNYQFESITFEKSTGKAISEYLKPNGWNNIQDKVAQSLCKYFEVQNNAELNDELSNCEYDEATQKLSIPLPVTKPYILNNNLIFVYQASEIAHQAAGAPEVSIALKDIKDQLSDVVAKYVK